MDGFYRWGVDQRNWKKILEKMRRMERHIIEDAAERWKSRCLILRAKASIYRYKLLLTEATSRVSAGQVANRGLFRTFFRCSRESRLWLFFFQLDRTSDYFLQLTVLTSLLLSWQIFRWNHFVAMMWW